MFTVRIESTQGPIITNYVSKQQIDSYTQTAVTA